MAQQYPHMLQQNDPEQLEQQRERDRKGNEPSPPLACEPDGRATAIRSRVIAGSA